MRSNAEQSRRTLIYPQRKSEEEENKEQFYQVKLSKRQMFRVFHPKNLLVNKMDLFMDFKKLLNVRSGDIKRSSEHKRRVCLQVEQ